MTPPNVQYGRGTQVILTLFNPNDILTHVYLLPDDKEDQEWTNSKVLTGCTFVMCCES